MLKIKDNIPLEKLEEYGFEYDDGYEWQGLIAYRYKVNDDYSLEVVNDTNELNIWIYDCNVYMVIPDLIFDLIQDGLVEKVKE